MRGSRKLRKPPPRERNSQLEGSRWSTLSQPRNLGRTTSGILGGWTDERSISVRTWTTTYSPVLMPLSAGRTTCTASSTKRVSQNDLYRAGNCDDQSKREIRSSVWRSKATHNPSTLLREQSSNWQKNLNVASTTSSSAGKTGNGTTSH